MYADAKVGSVISFNPIKDNSFYQGYTASTELANFFARPVRIRSDTWAEGSILDYTFFPWYDYFNNPQVKKKLDNFALLSCNLHVKFMINASPFFYGLAIASYAPQAQFSKHSFGNATGVDDITVVPLSQRPHVYLYPANSQGGEIVLPFINFKNWININSSAEFIQMGTMNVVDVVELLNANGVSAANVTISVYAWAEDVRLCAPTTSLSLQSDEYSGSVSGPASAVARIGNALGGIPVIGKFATATAMGASCVANVARMFGYTNVPNISNQGTIINQPFAHMASPEISTVVEKLTLDPKNELTIDPSTVGLESHDEMAISKIAQRESYIGTLTWTTSQAPDSLVSIVGITPRHLRTGSYGTVTSLYYTPMCLMTEMFRFWRGTIKVRVKIICSKFHKGRLRFTWDPIGDLTTFPVDSSNVAFTRIVDITEEQDLTFEIPFVQDRAWLLCKGASNTQMGPSVTNTFGITNGTMSIRVLNALTAPVTTSSIRVVVFVSGGADLEFANPVEPSQNISYLVPQSGDDDIAYEGEGSQVVNLGMAKTHSDDDYLVYQGEITRSLRQLIRRSNLMISLNCSPTGTSDVYNKQNFLLPRKILQYGYDVNPVGITSKGVLDPATQYPVVYAKVTPLSLLEPCYVGRRGSYHYRVNVDSNLAPANITVQRSIVNNPTTYPRVTPYVTTIAAADNNNQRSRARWASTNSCSAGLSLTNGLTQTGMNVSVPMYSRFRMLSVDPTAIFAANTPSDESLTDNIEIAITSHPAAQASDNLACASVDVYACAGTDYNLFLFLNVPAMFSYQIPAP